MVTKKKARNIVLMFLASVLSLHAKAQVSGVVTVPSTTYPTLNDVINALNTQGVSTSGATINFTANSPQTVPSGGYVLGSPVLNASLTAASPLVINGNGNTLVAAPGNSGMDGIFTIKGADYVTINSLNLQDTNTVNLLTEMEWGYGMVKLNNVAPFDGCQNNTISNCTVTLNRNNANSPTATSNSLIGGFYGGSKGIMFMNIALSNPVTQLAITSTTDAHNNNTVKGCTIQNCNIGVYMYGYNAASPYVLYDQNNTIGGNSVNDGNIITNFGGGGAFEADGIYINGYENNAYIRGNTINNTANNGIAAVANLNGIYHGNATGSSVSVRSNNISLTMGNAVATTQAIYLNCGGTNPNTINVDTNIIALTNTGATGNNAPMYGVNMNTGAVANILTCNANLFTATSSATGNLYGFNFGNTSIGTNPVWNIDDNKINSITRNGTVGYTLAGFYQTGSLLPATQFFFRRNKVTNVNQASLSSPIVNTPHFDPMYLNGGTSPYPTRIVSFDTISNYNVKGWWCTGIYVNNSGQGTTINNNLFTNNVDSGTAYGINIGNATGTISCYNNTISNFTNTGTGSTLQGSTPWANYPTYGIYAACGNATLNLYNNNLSNFQSNATLSTLFNGIDVCGIYLASAKTANVYNNMISDLRAPNATGFSPICGMYILDQPGGANGNGFYNVYHNTINLGVSSMLSSTGTDFGATGLFFPNPPGPNPAISNQLPTHLDLRNNIIRVNASPTGTGVVSAVRRSYGTAGVSPTGLTGPLLTSNGNIYWAPADANCYIYCEGLSLGSLVNAFSIMNDPGFNTACSNYKSFMNPGESSTYYENNLTQIGSGPVYAPSGSSYAKNNAIPTTAPAVTFDYNNATRPLTADAGALQFTGTTAGDHTPPVISYSLLAAKTFCVSAPALTATITDASGVNTTTNAPRLYYRKASEADTFGVYPTNNNASFNGWKYVTATNSGNNFSFAIDYSKLTSTVAGGDSIIYFVAAQDNATIPNVALSAVALAPGYCPTSVNLLPAAGPTLNQPVKNGYYIIPQPALPTVTPASPSVCLGASTKLTALPISYPQMASLGTPDTANASSFWPTPFGISNGSSHEQYLILASELTSQGVTFGNISSLAFNMKLAYSSSAFQNFSVNLGNTTTADLSAGTLINTGFTQVYANSAYTPPANTGWVTINFSTPFYWDGVSNVVVDVSFMNSASPIGSSSCTTTQVSAQNGQVYQTITPFISTLSVHGNNNCTLPTYTPSGTYTSQTTNQRPLMQLMGTQGFRVNWAPVSGLFKDSLMTMPVTATDTTPVVYAGPASNQPYAVMNVYSGCNSIPGVPSTVTVNPVPTATTTPAGTASLCGSSSVTLNGSTASGNTYQWNLAGTPVSGATNATYTTSTTGSYTFTATNSFGCSKTSPAVVVSNTAPPAATATATGATTFCQGGSVTINANTGSGLSYQWYNGTTPINNATAASYVATASGNYTVNVYNAANCFTTSNAVAVNVNPLNTTVTPSGSTSFCTGSSVTLSVPTAANQTYQWKNNGNPISGETNASYVANATGNYTVTVTNTVSSCTGTSTVTAVTVGTGPVAAIAPSGTINTCAGNTVTLTSSPVSGVTYQWLQNGNPIGGATNNSYGAAASGSYSLRVFSSPTCFTTSSATNVVVNPLPSIVTTPAAGPATVCQNGSTILSAPTGGNLGYQWSFNGNPINGATNYNYSAGNAGTYKVYVIDNQTGCDATSGNIVLSQLAAPTAPVATGGGAICAGDSVLVSSTTIGGLAYQWRNGSSNISGATSGTYYAKVAGSYTIVATNSNGCSASSNAIVVTQKPIINVTTTPGAGNATFCQNHPITLSVPTGANLSYQWKNGGNAISGATNNTYVTGTVGVYTVTVNNSQTGCTATSGNISLTSLPSPSVSITGPTAACMGDSVTYVASNNTSNCSYQWQMFGAPISGATSTTYKTPLTGTYRVVVTDLMNSCTDTSNVITLSLVNLPNATITGSSTICAGDTATLVVGSGTGYTYQWKLNSNNISGANGNVYKATAAGSYVVSVTNSNNCNNTSNQFHVTVNALPTVAIANNQSVLSTTGSFSTYQWYFNNTPIAGATSATFTPGQDGDYYLVVTDNNGCAGKSNVISMTGLSVRDVTASGIKVRVYPNPTTGTLNIDAPVKVNVAVRDLSGKLIKSVTEVRQIDLGDIAAGVYMMTVSDTNGMVLKVEKVFKTQ